MKGLRGLTCSTWVHLIGVGCTAAAVGLWYATGAEGYTRWPDPRLEASDAPHASGEDELLAEVGFGEAGSAAPRHDIQSRFAFGLVPGGLDPQHLLSVATVAAAATAASASTLAAGAMCRSRRARPSSPTQPPRTQETPT